jgi:hypothetical protein
MSIHCFDCCHSLLAQLVLLSQYLHLACSYLRRGCACTTCVALNASQTATRDTRYWLRSGHFTCDTYLQENGDDRHIHEVAVIIVVYLERRSSDRDLCRDRHV